MFIRDSVPLQTDSSYALQRKKSLPDVQDLVGVAAQQSSQEMTREEISVLSSARRDNVRRQMEEIERYKSNPIMYILNPRVQVRTDQQQQHLQEQQQQQQHSPLLAVTASCVAHLLTLGGQTLPEFVEREIQNENLAGDEDDDDDQEVVARDNDAKLFEDLDVD